MKLFDILEAVEVKEGRSRKELASGVDHMVFTATDNSDVVYKLGPRIAINYWFDNFSKNPDLFPKIYKRGRTSIKLKSEKTIRNNGDPKTFPVGTVLPLEYVILEKLDAGRAQFEWERLGVAVAEITEEAWIFQSYVIHYIIGGDMEMVEYVNEKIKEDHPQLLPSLKRFVNVIDKLKEITDDPDVHKHNFGYDKNGVLKCLDY